LTVTDEGEKVKFTIETLAEEDFFATGDESLAAPPAGASAGDPRPSCGVVSFGLLAASLGVPAAAPADVASGVVVTGAGSVVVGVVVVLLVVVPASCAAEIAGTAHTATRTSIPLARALAPFIDRIVRGTDSQSTTEYRGSWIA
jgi:hypothetical protein